VRTRSVTLGQREHDARSGTRVPIYIPFDHLVAHPDGLNQFLEDYDHISWEAVNAVLEQAKHARTDPDDLAVERRRATCPG
jgi:hypothetical protein